MRKPAEEDTRLFREAMRGVRPLDHPPRVTHRRKPKPKARFRRRDEVEVLAASLELSESQLDVETGESLNFRRPGVQDTVLRKLRRGQYRIESEIDLHGLTLREAKAELRVFLARAIARQLRCVRIVHGKGLGSGPRGPVLKHAVNGLLQRTDRVVAFCSARPVDGGTGAIYVLLHS